MISGIILKRVPSIHSEVKQSRHMVLMDLGLNCEQAFIKRQILQSCLESSTEYKLMIREDPLSPTPQAMSQHWILEKFRPSWKLCSSTSLLIFFSSVNLISHTFKLCLAHGLQILLTVGWWVFTSSCASQDCLDNLFPEVFVKSPHCNFPLAHSLLLPKSTGLIQG